MILFPCLVWAALALFVNGQQFDGYEMPYDDLGLSDACFDAVNTTVSSCPAWVARYTGIECVSQHGTERNHWVRFC